MFKSIFCDGGNSNANTPPFRCSALFCEHRPHLRDVALTPLYNDVTYDTVTDSHYCIINN